MKTTYEVFVDGVGHGEVFKRAGRWYWLRGRMSTEPFPRSLTKAEAFEEIAEWARRVCRGKAAEVRKLEKSDV